MAVNPQARNAASVLGRRGRLELDEVLATLVVDGLLSADDAKRVRGSDRSGKSALELHPLVLVGTAKVPNQREPRKPLSVESLTVWLAEKAALPYLKIDPMKIDAGAVTQAVSHAYAQRHRILPVAVDGNSVTFATAEPFDTPWAADLAQMIRREINLVVANPLDVNRYLLEFYGVQRSIALARDAKQEDYDSGKLLNFEQLLELGKGGEIGADDRHVVHIVDWLLQYAFDQRASDIHLEPRREAGHIRFRIDGVLHKVFELPPPVMTAVTAASRSFARMDIAEKRRPQDGRIKTRSSGGREVELRISTMPTAFGEKVVMRIFDPDIVVKAFAQLGFAAQEEELWRQMVERPHGIVLVTGPTGSGKTTTLYSTLKHLAKPEVNVCTIEDPIEMVATEFNQIAGAAGDRSRFRRRRAHAAAAGSGHHHDRRNPRPGNRADGGAGLADRPSRAVHAAHQRCAVRGHAPARPRRAALSDPVHARRRGRATTGAHAVSALQGGRHGGRGRLARAHARLGLCAAGARLRPGRMPRMPQYRLPGTHRHLRNDDDQPAPARDDLAGA